MLGRLLREPLLHFFVLGALIFGAFALRQTANEENTATPGQILIGPGEIDHVATTFARTWQRPPTDAELDSLIDNFVRDEIYYREGLRLGLERGDTIVRRRVREKMEFLVEDAMAAAPPSDDVLQAFLAAHPERFRREPELSFRQLYLDRDRRGDRAAEDARDLVARLAASDPDLDISDLGDPIMLPSDFDKVPESEVATTFGDAFASVLATLPIAKWTGPIESGYGLHVVLVRERSAGRLPALDEVRDAVAREVTAEQRKRMVDASYQALRSRYEVIVERPGGGAAAARQDAPAQDATR